MAEPIRTRNVELLADFLRYRAEHPEQRFWQALRNWSGAKFIFVRTHGDHAEGNLFDTFHWEDKDG